MPVANDISESIRRERPRCIDIKSKIVLTQEGADFFQNRKLGLHRFDAPDGDVRYGFKLRSVDVPWLRRLLLAGFVEKAEFPVRDLGVVKNEVGDLARLAVFSMHYGYFRSSSLARALDSEVIRRWNRGHPHQAMDAKTVNTPMELKNVLKSRSEAVNALKEDLSTPLLHSIASNAKRTDTEQQRLYYFVQELLAFSDPLVYFVLLCSGQEERQAISRDIVKILESCLDRVDLADYLSLMVLEIMGAAERSTLVELIGYNVPPSEIRAKLENPETRMQLLAGLPNGLASALVWSINRRWSLGRWRYRLHFSLHDGSSSFEDTKRLFEERGRLSLGDRSLLEFYESGTGPYGDDGMGWYYLSFIAEACEHMNVNFEASVRERPGKGTGAVNFSLIF